MEKIYDGNFWEVTVPEAKESMRYKYRIYRQDGSFLDHCDPYGLSSELRPHNASVICSLKHHTFRDQEWMAGRGAAFRQAVNIYELHAGSWRKKGDGSEDWYSYEELAKLLNISENQLSYITNVPAGHGLIRCGGAIIPFENSFPKNTKLYQLMTTKPDETF